MYETNRSIRWLEENPDEDPTTYALQHLDYYRGLYDKWSKPGARILEKNEIFFNGHTGHFLVIGADKPFWCTAISEEEAQNRIKKNHYVSELTNIFKKHVIDKKMAELGFVDPNKVIYFSASEKTKQDLGLNGNLMGMAPRMISEKDIKYWQKEIIRIVGNKADIVLNIAYPKIDVKSITVLCHIIDNLVSSVPDIMDKLCLKTDKENVNHIIAHLATEKAPDYALERADNISEDIEKTKKIFSPSITEIVIALANKGIGAKRQGRYDDAIQYYKAVIKLLPENGGIYYNLGKLFYITGNFEKARRAYTLAYIFGTPNDDYNLFLHLGHAIKDEEYPDNPYVKTYRDTICGKQNVLARFLPDSNADKQYISLAMSRINDLKHDYESRL